MLCPLNIVKALKSSHETFEELDDAIESDKSIFINSFAQELYYANDCLVRRAKDILVKSNLLLQILSVVHNH